MLELLQMLFDNLDSFNGPYVRCWKACNELQPSGTPTGVTSANASKWILIFVILVLQKGEMCLNTFYMMFVMCWDQRFGLDPSLSQNSIVTCYWSKFWRFERDFE